MGKKIYLSPTEQKIWEQIKDKSFIDTELIRIIFPDYSLGFVYKILHSFYKKGWLKKAKRNFYYVPENVSNYWDIALKVHSGYLGLSSALRFHNLMSYEDFRIFVITRERYDKIKLENYDVAFLPLRNYYKGFKRYGEYFVSTPEKTIFDCFLKVGLVGYSIVTSALNDTKNFDWKEFLSYFKGSNNKSLHQRTGYILELMAEKINFNVPRFVLSYLSSMKGSRAKLGGSRGKSVFSKKWNIQDGVGEKNIFGWWY